MQALSQGATDELLATIKRDSKHIRPIPVPVTESGSLPRRPRSVLFDAHDTLLVRIGDVHPRGHARGRDGSAAELSDLERIYKGLDFHDDEERLDELEEKYPYGDSFLKAAAQVTHPEAQEGYS